MRSVVRLVQRTILAAACILVAMPGTAGRAAAHGAGHVPVETVLEQPGFAVAFRLSSGEAMADAPYRLLAPGEGAPLFQSGHTDALGRLAFVPDRPGGWRIDVEGAAGHRASAVIDIGSGGAVPEQPAWRRWLLRASVLLNIALLGLLAHVTLGQRRSAPVRTRPMPAVSGDRS